MNCHIHHDRQAQNRCAHCGQYMCEECAVDINGVSYCKSCVAQMAASGGRRMDYPPPPQSYHPPRPPRSDCGINAFFLLCLSVVPGLNYMYLGLMKRGMFFMAMFFGLIFLAAALDTPMLAFALFIELSYSFFDGFRIRRGMINGIHVEDTVGDITELFYRNKRMFIAIFGVIIALSAVEKLANIFRYSMNMMINGRAYWVASELFSFITGVLIMLVGIYIIFRGRKRRDDTNRNQGL